MSPSSVRVLVVVLALLSPAVVAARAVSFSDAVREHASEAARQAETAHWQRIIADQEADVFRGIVLTHGLLMPKRSFITAEHIVGVSGDMVEVDLSRSDAEKLPAPPVVGAT